MSPEVPEGRSLRHASADSQLVRALGVRSLAAAIFNYTVGSGIFALPTV